MSNETLPSSPTFCVLPWFHVTLRSNGEARVCCRHDDRLPGLREKAGSLKNVLYTDHFKNIREQMLRGERPPGCQACYRQEESGSSSNRTEANFHLANMWNETPRLTYLELALGNLCNLSCRTCASLYSSKWIADERALGYDPLKILPLSRADVSILEDSYEHLNYIKMIGGEPLLSPDNEKILAFLDSKGRLPHIMFDYFTNATVRVSDRVMEYWLKSNGVSLVISIDGLRERNDYIRRGSQWQEVISNAAWFREKLSRWPGRFAIHNVVTIYNIRDIPATDRWIREELPDVRIGHDCLRDPKWQNIRNLPEPDKKEIAALYADVLTDTALDPVLRSSYESIVYLMQQTPEAPFDDFIRWDRSISALDGTRLADYFPELAASVARYEKQNRASLTSRT